MTSVASVASRCLAAAAAAVAAAPRFARFYSVVACLLAALLAPPAEALYSGVHAGTSCMHFFGFGTKATRSEGQRRCQVPSRQLSLVSGMSTSNLSSGVQWWPKPLPAQALTVPIPARYAHLTLTRFAATPMPVLRLLAGRHTTEHARF
ncbi:uncharacterized protein TrAFT101_002388 [Trichoderma asperellum]|uniref:Secreted protein n=1 Tax=Trichoderma asperellum (strain ATCC 204424 / CBS 433.97 / NBRC 101777) TaxID=1042311 RepID=A0A2T3ZG77_TRIA4|nr:hypothetical protein M441DRAFT_336027 [Trichoderma asperellum CBS 433.97]PTB43789.1 hypothetical protein M441DRAFT_336027 [Trichoderma asperellum CBS 433.97]UKZ86565.1 hypothetical protein TrAFT101_002388 [Trichoderma asperellum]